MPILAVAGSLLVATEDDAVTVRIGDSGRLVLQESQITEIKLATLEGNFYFRMDIKLGHATVVIADEELQGLGFFGG